MSKWNLSDAKNRFSELVTLALTKGPQRVRRREEEVVVVSAEEYDRLTAARGSFKDHLMRRESMETLDLERDDSAMREVDL